MADEPKQTKPSQKKEGKQEGKQEGKHEGKHEGKPEGQAPKGSHPPKKKEGAEAVNGIGWFEIGADDPAAPAAWYSRRRAGGCGRTHAAPHRRPRVPKCRWPA